MSHPRRAELTAALAAEPPTYDQMDAFAQAAAAAVPIARTICHLYPNSPDAHRLRDAVLQLGRVASLALQIVHEQQQDGHQVVS